MADEHADILIRVRAKDEATDAYPVEATLDDGSFFDGGELRLDWPALLEAELDPEAYGRRLFETLFAGPIRSAYDKVTGRAEAEAGGRLRVRLWIDKDAAELHALPWERLYHLHKGHWVPLSTSTRTPFSRYTRLRIREPDPVAERPIGLLIAISNPRNLPGGLQEIVVEQEVENLRLALGDLRQKDQIQVTLLPGRTGLPLELREQLEREGYQIQDGETSLDNILRELPGCHVLHFLGHGHFRREDEHERGEGTAALYLEKEEDGTWEAVTDDKLVDKLTAVDPVPHLVFLAACESAKTEVEAEAKKEHPFVGLGPKLVGAGVPAVVAMQDKVGMDLAQQLTGDFYRNLLEHGLVDRALNQARLLLFEQDQVDWAIPVLFSRLTDNRLVAQPEGDKAEVIKIKLFERETWQPWLRQRLTPGKVVAGLITLVGLVATLLGLYRDPGIQRFLFGPTPTPTPIATPAPMSGDFNVAVAEFGKLDTQGSVIESPAGSDLSEDVYSLVNAALKPLKSDGFKPEVWPPALVGRIEGLHREEWAEHAEKEAKKINADVVIYGNLEFGDDVTNLVPEFYLSNLKLRDTGELGGHYEFGSEIKIGDNIAQNPAAAKEFREQVTKRTNVLAQFVIGLGYYALDRFGDATEYFEAAEPAASTDDQDDKAVRKVLYLFLGSTAAQRQDLDAALDYYELALGDDPRYARAQVGAALIRFLQSRDDCQPDQVDVDGLREAEKGFKQARAGRHPSLADISTKAALGLGRTYLCLSMAQVADHWADAELEYRNVVADYNDENERVKELAAEAHADLGLLYLSTPDSPDAEAAAEEYAKAIDLSRHADRQAVFYVQLAYIHLRLEECEKAGEALNNADEAYGTFVSRNPNIERTDYEDFRQQAQRAWDSTCQ